MNPIPSPLTELAKQIANNQATANWQFWIILGLLFLVVFAIGAVVMSFFTEQGKMIATNAGFIQALENLKKTTEETEKIKLRLAHGDWTLKEIKTLKRTKIEQLLTATYATLFSLEDDSSLDIGESNWSEMPSKMKFAELHQISSLYFPELSMQTKRLSDDFWNFHKWRLIKQHGIRDIGIQIDAVEKVVKLLMEKSHNDEEQIKGKIENLGVLMNKRSELLNEYTDEYNMQYGQIRSSIDAFKTDACALMPSFLNKIE